MIAIAGGIILAVFALGIIGAAFQQGPGCGFLVLGGLILLAIIL